MTSDETRDLPNEEQDVEGHKVAREVWSREGADEEDTEGHKAAREVWSREGADEEDDVEGHKFARE